MNRLFRVASAFSAVACLATTASWLRSYWTYDQIACGNVVVGESCTWKGYPRSYPFTTWPPASPESTVAALFMSFGKISLNWHSYSPTPLAATSGRAWRSDENSIPRFSYFYAKTADMVRQGTWTVVQASFPHWTVVVMFSIVPMFWIRKRWRTSARPSQRGQAA